MRATLDGDIGWSQGLKGRLHVTLGNGGQPGRRWEAGVGVSWGLGLKLA